LDRPIDLLFPIIISTSSKEGEWYRHHLFSDPIDIFAKVNIVEASTLKDITDSQLLKGSLDRRMSAEVSISRPTLRFVAGAGDDRTEVIVDAQTGLKILLAIVANLDTTRFSAKFGFG